MINAQPLPMATYSKKHYWQTKADPEFFLMRTLAKEIQVEIDKEMIKALHGAMSVKDGNK